MNHKENISQAKVICAHIEYLAVILGLLVLSEPPLFPMSIGITAGVFTLIEIGIIIAKFEYFRTKPVRYYICMHCFFLYMVVALCCGLTNERIIRYAGFTLNFGSFGVCFAYFQSCFKILEGPYPENAGDVLKIFECSAQKIQLVRYFLMFGSINDAFMKGMDIYWIIFAAQLALTFIMYFIEMVDYTNIAKSIKKAYDE